MKPRSIVVITLVVAAGLVLGGREAAAIVRQESGGQEQDPPRRIEERVIITASRVPEALLDVGSSVTVITADQIEASGARWLVDVLATAPGVTVVRSGGPGASASVFLRGTESNHTLFLINGVKVNSPTTGAYNLEHLAAHEIERIEIVRGPQSTLYGSEAIGGVINVITRTGGERLTAGIEADGGSYGTGRFQGWVRGGGPVRYSAGVALYGSDGFSTAAEERGNPEPDSYDNVSFDGRIRYETGSGVEVDAFVRAFDATTDIDDFAFGVGPVDDGNFVSDAREIYGSGTIRYRGADWTTVLTLSDSELGLETLNPDAAFFGFGLDASIREIDWQNELSLPANQALIAGAEYRHEGGVVLSESIFGTSDYDEAVDVVGVFVQDRLTLGDRAALSIGGRLESHSTFGYHATYRVTASVEVAPPVRVHGSVGSAFRAPSLNDLFFPGFGNIDLEPEESVGFDLGVGARSVEHGLGFDATYFRNDIDNLVAFAPTGPENLGDVLTQGVELTGQWAPVPRADLSISYTFTDAEDRRTGLELIRRPRHQGSVGVTFYPRPGMSIYTELRSKGRTFDDGPSGRVALDSFALWNVAAEIPVTGRLSIQGRVDNVLDADYAEVFGYGVAGLSGYIGAALRYGGR